MLKFLLIACGVFGIVIAGIMILKYLVMAIPFILLLYIAYISTGK